MHHAVYGMHHAVYGMHHAVYGMHHAVYGIHHGNKSKHFMFLFIVMFAFEQCLLCFAFHPDMWYEAASYLENTCRELIERGVSE